MYVSVNVHIQLLQKVKKVREGQTVDALALGGDEGRDKLRKAWGRCK